MLCFLYVCICAGVCGAIKNDLVYSNATLALKAFSDGACAVVADQACPLTASFMSTKSLAS